MFKLILFSLNNYIDINKDYIQYFIKFKYKYKSIAFIFLIIIIIIFLINII